MIRNGTLVEGANQVNCNRDYSENQGIENVAIICFQVWQCPQSYVFRTVLIENVMESIRSGKPHLSPSPC